MSALALSVLGVSAMSAAAEDTVKIGYIDPLSGGGASAFSLKFRFVYQRGA